MSTYTKHYNAKKPSKSENYDIDVANFNNDLWDEKIFEKQDKVVGKALSTNDFTNAYKTKLDSLKNYDDTEVKSNIENIQVEQVEQDAKIQFLQSENTELKSENERLREDLKGLPTGTFSDEAVDLNDSSEMRLQELKIFGNSRQKTREGKNRVKSFSVTLPKTIISPSSNYAQVSIYYDDKFINKFQENGFTIKIKTKNPLTKAFTSVALNSGWTTRIQFSEFTRREKDGYIIYENRRTNANFTPANGIVLIFEDTTQQTGCDLYDVEVDLGDTVGQDFEEYGVSPSPLYPSEIECCGDNVNLFDGECEMGNISTSTGQNTGSNEAWRSKNYTNIKNKDITISVKDKTFNGTAGRLYFYKNDNTYISNVLINSLPFTATVPSEATKVRFFLLNSVANINSKVKIEDGSTPTPYSKYGQGNISFEICNKNLFDKDTMLIKNGLWIDSDIMKLISNSTSWYVVVPIIGNKQITISKKYSQEDYSYIRFLYTTTQEYPNVNISMLDFIGGNHTQKKLTFISNPNAKYLFIGLANGASLTDAEKANIIEKLQVEYSSSNTEYTKHKSQSYTIPTQKPFRKVGDYEDTFVKKNGKRYEKHYIQRKVLDGSNNFVIGNPSNRFYLDISLNNLNYEAKSNYFKTGEENQFGTSGTVVLQTNRINLMTNEFTNANDFNDWILERYNAGNPVYIDYVLQTPEDIECTEEQNQILDKIENEAKTYKNITHMYSTDEISPKFEGKYNKDIETMINNRATTVAESEV